LIQGLGFGCTVRPFNAVALFDVPRPMLMQRHVAIAAWTHDFVLMMIDRRARLDCAVAAGAIATPRR